jgi:hypothetical protein
MESRIQSYLRFAASQQRDTERIGPFLATFSRHSANPYLNYAIPDDGAAPSLADVNAPNRCVLCARAKAAFGVCRETSACCRRNADIRRFHR